MNEYLHSTAAIESNNQLIKTRAFEIIGDASSEPDKARRLFAFVRDRIPYNLFMISMHPDDFRASFILDSQKGYCVQKAVLLCALSRSVRIPSRLALARIRNHRLPQDIRTRLGRNEFPGHGYNQLFIDDHWVSAAATFDAALCARIGVPTVEFDGHNDAMLPDKALDGGPYIEYLEHYGSFSDLPLEFITERTSKIWGRKKRSWLRPEDDTGFP